MRAIAATGNDPVLDRAIEPEIDNMRAALDWCLGAPDHVWTGFRIATGLSIYWRRSGLLREGIEWVERALSATSGSTDPERARGFASLSDLAYFRGDLERAHWASERALETVVDDGDDECRLAALMSASRLDLYAADAAIRERGMRMNEQALEIARRTGNLRAEMVLCTNLGEALRGRGDLEGARERYEEAMRHMRGEARHAILFNLGQVAVEQGHADRAEEWYREAYAVSGRSGDRLGWAYEIIGMGQVAALRSELVRAARLFGAATAALETFGEQLNPVDQRVLDRSVAACSAALDRAVFEEAWIAGRALDPERALDQAFRLEAI